MGPALDGSWPETGGEKSFLDHWRGFKKACPSMGVEEDAIMVGTKTAVKDNPSLTVRCKRF